MAVLLSVLPELLIAIIVIAVFLSFVALYGDNRILRPTIIGRFRSWLKDGLPQMFGRRVTGKFVGDHGCSMLKASNFFEMYVMPVSYFGLLAAGLFTANKLLIPRLESLENLREFSQCPRSRFLCMAFGGATLSFPPPTRTWMLYAYVILLPVCWCLVRYTDPLTVPRYAGRWELNLYPFDEVMYPRDKVCHTCHSIKRARSKHCRLCDRCVVRFDHHCGWVATCVGLGNHRYFLLFLLLHSFALIHGSLVGCEIIKESMLNIIEAGYMYAPTGTIIRRFSLSVAFAAEPNIFVLAIIFSITGILVLGFLLWHVYLVSINLTTSESYKWQGIMEGCKTYERENGRSLMEAWEEETKDDPDEFVPLFGEDGLPVRIYDEGFRKNVKQVLCPNLYIKRSTCR